MPYVVTTRAPAAAAAASSSGRGGGAAEQDRPEDRQVRLEQPAELGRHQRDVIGAAGEHRLGGEARRARSARSRPAAIGPAPAGRTRGRGAGSTATARPGGRPGGAARPPRRRAGPSAESCTPLGTPVAAAGGDDHGHLGGHADAVRACRTPFDVGGAQRVERRPQRGAGQVGGQGQHGGAAAGRAPRRRPGTARGPAAARRRAARGPGRPLPVHRMVITVVRLVATDAGSGPGAAEGRDDVRPEPSSRSPMSDQVRGVRPSSAKGRGRLEGGGAVRGHRLRDRRGHREDHDQPRPAAQRLRARRPPSSWHAFDLAQADPEVNATMFTAVGRRAFCSSGDQKIRGDDGYVEGRPERGPA